MAAEKPFVLVEFDNEKRVITVNWRNREPVTVPLDGCEHENRSPLSFSGVPVPLCNECRNAVFGK